MVSTWVESLITIFGWVLGASFMAGILIALVLSLQYLLKNKLEARWKYLLWLPVAIRLLLPWAPESSLSLYNIFSLEAVVPGIHQHMQGSAVATSGHVEGPFKPQTSITNGTAELSTPSHELGTEQERGYWWNGMMAMTFTHVMMMVWLAGVLFLTVKTVYDHLRLQRAVRAGRRIETPYLSALFHETKELLGVKRDVQFVASERIPGPAVVGSRKPAVIISPSLLITLQKDQLQYILAHEFAHIRRRDVAVNWVMHSLLILHWFNPLLWLAVHRVRQDQEMACDACVLDRMSPQRSSAYGQTIIHVLEHFSGNQNQPGLAGLSATHKQMKRRLIMIKQFHKKSYRLSILGMATILTLGCVTLVNAKDAGNAPQAASVQMNQDTTTPQFDIIYPEGVETQADRELYKKEYEQALKKATEAAKALTVEERRFIETETNRVKALPQETGVTYVMYHKYKDLNNGRDLSFWGGVSLEYTSYEEYLAHATALKGPLVQEPNNLPKGFTLSKARIDGPTATEGKFMDDVRAEGKQSGKPLYTKKMEWNEAATLRLEYTNGKDSLTISRYTLDPAGSSKKGFFEDDLPAHVYPKYVFWHDDKFEYSISTTMDMSKDKKIEILKAAVKNKKNG